MSDLQDPAKGREYDDPFWNPLTAGPSPENAYLGVAIPADPDPPLVYNTGEDGIYTVRFYQTVTDLKFTPTDATEPVFAARAIKTGSALTNPAPTILGLYEIQCHVNFDPEAPVNPFYFRSIRIHHASIPTPDQTILHRLTGLTHTKNPSGGNFTPIKIIETTGQKNVFDSEAVIDFAQVRYNLGMERPPGTIVFTTQWKRVKTIVPSAFVEFLLTPLP